MVSLREKQFPSGAQGQCYTARPSPGPDNGPDDEMLIKVQYVEADQPDANP